METADTLASSVNARSGKPGSLKPVSCGGGGGATGAPPCAGGASGAGANCGATGGATSTALGACSGAKGRPVGTGKGASPTSERISSSMRRRSRWSVPPVRMDTPEPVSVVAERKSAIGDSGVRTSTRRRASGRGRKEGVRGEMVEGERIEGGGGTADGVSSASEESSDDDSSSG